jgi:hypothetical protein
MKRTMGKPARTPRSIEEIFTGYPFHSGEENIPAPNGLRYWRWGGHGLCLGEEETRSQKNA